MPMATKPTQSRANPKPASSEVARAVLKPGGNRVVAVAEHPTKVKITKKKPPPSPPKDEEVVAPPKIEESVVRGNVSVDSTCSSDSSLSGSSNKNNSNKNNSVVKRKRRVNNATFISQSPKPSSGPPKRCDWITPNADPRYTAFHDEEWGVPVIDDKKLFELLVFSQALAEYSWPAILNQRHIFRKLFENFEPSSVSEFTDKKLLTLKINGSSLLSEPKLRAIVENAKQILKVVKEFGSFSNYCWRFVNHKPLRNEYRYGLQVPAKTPKAEVISKDMMRRGFQCVGPTVVYSFMQVAGLVNDHLITCFRYQQCRVTTTTNELKTVVKDIN
ncbi:hypothetical protein HN51_052169 [Arachis hypogaea]|uniref:uncharacterized protein LOC107610150 n=1 Tax=Arachis ipaensis TaxID=130454 RepID=UPI0007AF85F0|nr:uncharacterized protein LOC107610150 [Arachis ipaensis]XP_025668331.1 uncharacterized protein LOC112766652 [Arachis hypogaea]